MEYVELVMPRKTRPARHERVVAIPNRIGGDIAEVRTNGIRRCTLCRLLRHPDRFISREQDKLRTVDVVGFNQNPIPGGVARAGSERRRARDVVAGYGSGGTVAHAGRVVDKIAETLPEPRPVRSVLTDNLDVKMLTEV